MFVFLYLLSLISIQLVKCNPPPGGFGVGRRWLLWKAVFPVHPSVSNSNLICKRDKTTRHIAGPGWAMFAIHLTMD